MIVPWSATTLFPSPLQRCLQLNFDPSDEEERFHLQHPLPPSPPVRGSPREREAKEEAARMLKVETWMTTRT